MRFKPWAATALLSVAATALAACGSSGGDSSPNPAPTDKTLKIAFLQDPGQPPDPDVFYAGQGLLLTTNIYEGLLQYKSGTATPTLQPLLATAWTASPDNRVYDFTLRQGVKFHDGTPFTSAAVKASFDRRLAVNQGPAYMVSDVASVVPKGDYEVTVTLKAPNSAFLDYMASPYGPRMVSPSGLTAHAGGDNAQKYLSSHDLGTGPYELTDASVGSHYGMKAFDGYWGAKPYFQTIDIPVVNDASSQQLQFNNGQLAAILSGLPTSAVESYIKNKKFSSYSLPSMMSNSLYLNPNHGVFTSQAARTALQQAVDVSQITKQTYFGRGKDAKQIYPPNMLPEQYGTQNITHDTSALQKIVQGLPASERTITIGYDSGAPDNQLISNLLQTQLSAVGFTAKVQSYPTSQIYGWIGNKNAGAPDIFTELVWPDAPSPFTWGHISWDASGGLNYLSCPADAASATLNEALPSGDNSLYGKAGEQALQTGCWLNLTDVNDFMVGQSWLKGIEQSHIVTNPTSLYLAGLSVG